MKYLEGVLDNLDTAVVDDFGLVDIDKFRDIQNPGQEQAKDGKRVTRKMVIDASLMAEELDEITTLMLAQKKITVFDDNMDDATAEDKKFKVADMCNVECLMASHNYIKDISGVL